MCSHIIYGISSFISVSGQLFSLTTQSLAEDYFQFELSDLRLADSRLVDLKALRCTRCILTPPSRQVYYISFLHHTQNGL